MAGPFEAGGWALGGLIGGANGGATQAGPAITEGMAIGGAAGGASGAVAGTFVEPGGGTFVGGALGARMGAALGGVAYGTGPFIQGAIAGAPGGATQGQAIGKGIDDAISGWWQHIMHADNKADEHSDQPADQCAGQCGGTDDSSQPWIVPPELRAKIPSAWGDGLPNKKKEGQRWTDPENEGNGVRIDHGDPTSSQPSQQEDHVIVRSGGKIIGRDGEAISGSIADNAEQAHIPAREYSGWSAWNKP